ncbi:MAG: glutamate synthase [Anaeromyxobacter sp.]|nr:glutamate synthase [Anaeromyxobacter sp.]
MAELTPVPFGALVTRLFTELERRQAAFDLPARAFVTSGGGRDLSTSLHGHRASTPFGPAAGPHTQLAQNIVLAWLAGGRIMELKTVQVKDDLVIPRPCIDMATVGYNVEWSQELKLEQSLEEYVKAAMLVEMLKASGLAPGFGDTVYDMSVGYDLAGVRSPRVRAFMAGLLDAGPVVERLRRQIPAPFAHLRDLAFPTRLSDTLTLSTFHGCPPEEIEAIAAFLLEEVGLHVIVKLNPTLLGKVDLRDLLHRRLGYRDLAVPDQAFEQDARWDQVTGFVDRLGASAARLGRGFGVKFTNTLVVENHRTFFPATERLMYLSGPPLHVLAMTLVDRFRATFGDRHPISFSAGVDAANFPDAVALGLGPVSVCTDLLRAGGYGRGRRYFEELGKRMEAVRAPDLETFSLLAYGQAEGALVRAALPAPAAAACRLALRAGGDLRAAAGAHWASWVSAARLLGTSRYAAGLADDPRYAAARNATPPRKVGSALALFDCLTCDKCIPVCPNDANFSLPLAAVTLAVERLVPAGGRFTLETGAPQVLVKPRQIATFADACNECGHCDVMCPEDGGPYAVKPNFFGSVASWSAAPTRDGFALERVEGGVRMVGRVAGRTYQVWSGGARLRYAGDGFDLRLDPADPAGTAEGTATGPVELTWLRVMEALRGAVTGPDTVNFVSASLEAMDPPRPTP